MSRRSLRWAVLISGRGSNLAAILAARHEVDLALVISSSAKATGLLRAKRAGVPTLVLPSPIDWDYLNEELKRRQIERVFLAGFMKLVPERFLHHWESRILNLHPSLLPAYPGLKSIEKAHADQVDMGVTVHEVIPEVDAGRILIQRCCLRAEEVCQTSLDDAEFFVHVNEQRIVMEAVRRWNVQMKLS